MRAYRNLSLVRLPALEHPLRAAVFLALVSQVLNTFGIGLPQSVGGFLIGLYLLVLVMALNFAYLMYVLVRDDNDLPAAS